MLICRTFIELVRYVLNEYFFGPPWFAERFSTAVIQLRFFFFFFVVCYQGWSFSISIRNANSNLNSSFSIVI